MDVQQSMTIYQGKSQQTKSIPQYQKSYKQTQVEKSESEVLIDVQWLRRWISIHCMFKNVAVYVTEMRVISIFKPHFLMTLSVIP